MPAYSFQKQFVPFIESGEKTHTIRAKRKNPPKPGQKFYGYYAMRTKQCRKLFEGVITRVQHLTIRDAGMSKPLAIDLYCGLGGWAEGLLAEGYHVIGFDIERHDYGTGGYPGTLVLRDIRTIHGSEFKDATLIVGSSPCQKYSYMAMPWSRAKAMEAYYSDAAYPERLTELNELFDAQFRIQREASEAAGRHIPMVVENVRGAQKWVGRAAWHHGSFYLWGDVPALMPITMARVQKAKDGSCKRLPGAQGGRISGWPHKEEDSISLDNKDESVSSTDGPSLDGRKIPSIDLPKLHPKSISPEWRAKATHHITDAAKRVDEQGIRGGGDWFGSGENCSLQRRFSGSQDGTKFSQSGDEWFDSKPRDKMLGDKGPAASVSRSSQRKMASAMIAKIPLPLSTHIARSFYPREATHE